MGMVPVSHRTAPPFGPYHYYRPTSAAASSTSSSSFVLCRHGPRCFFFRLNSSWSTRAKTESHSRDEVHIQSPVADASMSLRHSRHGRQYNEKYVVTPDRYVANHTPQAAEGMLNKHHLSVEMVAPRMNPPTTGSKLTTGDGSLWVLETLKCRNSKRRSYIDKEGKSEVISIVKSTAKGPSDPRFCGNYPDISDDEKATVLYS